MEVDSEDTVLKNKQFLVTVKEVCADNSVEIISISKALVEILAKDPVCGRSDYSDLPGVERNFRSPWRSFADYPRRANVGQRSITPVTSEEKHRRSYLARIRREKLTLQRVAKRERVRAQQRERSRQQNLLYKLQNQPAESADNILLNPGVIISSPIKGSPGKLWKDNHRRDSKCHNKSGPHGIGKIQQWDKDFQKPLTGFQEKLHCGLGDSKDQLKTFLDEVVSTTSVHRTDGCVEKAVDFLNYPPSEVAKLTSDKTFSGLNAFTESEENPVTSSQDPTDKCLSQSLLKAATSSHKSALWTVTSTTAPEIVDADSSTPRIVKRKTRNVKRVNYTEMLEDDFDQDVEQQIIRQSKTSGRKIRPVKRTLERAIVDASMKKSPRKRKAILVDKDRSICPETASVSSATDKDRSICPETASASSATDKDTENRQFKQVACLDNLPLVPEKEKISNLQGNTPLESQANEHLPSSGSANSLARPLPMPVSGVSQHPALMCLNTGKHITSASNLHPTTKLAAGQIYLSNPFESSKAPANVVLTCQPGLISFNQQLYSTPPAHNIPQNLASIIPSTGIQNPAFAGFSNFNLLMQSPFQRPLSVMNSLGSSSFLVSHFPPNQVNPQIHNISQPFSVNILPHPTGSRVHSVSQPVNAPPNFLIDSQLPVTTSKESVYFGTPQQVVSHEAASGKEGFRKPAAMSCVSKCDPALSASNVPRKKQTPNTPAGSKDTDLQKTNVPSASNKANKAALEMTSNRAALEMTSNRAALEMTSNRAALEMTSNRAALEMTSNRAALEMTSNRAALEMTSNRAAQDMTSNRAAQDMTSNRAAQDMTSNRAAQDMTSNRAAQDMTSNRAAQDMTSNRAAQEMTSNRAAQEMTSNRAAQEMAKAAQDMTSNKAAQEMAKAAQDMTSNRAAQDMTSNRAAQEMTSNRAAQDMTSNRAAQEMAKAAQKMTSNMSQHFLAEHGKHSVQGGSTRPNPPAASNHSKGSSTESPSCQKQGPLYVESMLSSVHKKPAEGQSTVHSNNQGRKTVHKTSEATSVQNIKSSDNIPTAKPQGLYSLKDLLHLNKSTQSHTGSTSFPQAVQSSGSHASSTNGQPTVTLPSHQRQANPERCLGPPPPLISISDLFNLPTDADSYNNNYGASALVSYQDKQSSYENKHAVPVHPTSQATLVAADRPVHQSDNPRQRLALTSQSSSVTEHQLVSSMHQQSSAPSQPSYLQSKHIYMPSRAEQASFVRPIAGRVQAQLSGMPTLPCPVNCSGSSRTVNQNTRMPNPLQVQYCSMSSGNSAPQRITTPRIVTSLAQQVPPQMRSQLNNMSKAAGVNRLASSHRPTMKQMRALLRHFPPQAHRHNSIHNTIVQVVTQPTPTTLQETSPSDFWRLPLFTPEQTSTMSGKTTMGMQLHTQPSHITSPGNNCPLQSSQPQVSGENLSTGKGCVLPSASSSGSQCLLSVNNEQQRSLGRTAQRVSASSPNVPSSLSTNSSAMVVPHHSANVTQGSDKRLDSLRRPNLVVVSTSNAALLSAHAKQFNSAIPCALDLSRKTSQVAQTSLTTPTALRSLPDAAAFSLKQNQVITTISTPRVAYDYPLAQSQVKQEFLPRPETDSNEILQPGLQTNQTSSRTEVTSTISSHTDVPTTSFAKAQLTNEQINPQEPIANTSVTTKPRESSSSKHLPTQGLVNIKVEAHLSPGDSAEIVTSVPTPSTSLITQAPSLGSAAHSTLAISRPVMSNLSTYLKSIVDTTKNVQTGISLHVDQTRYTGVNGHNNMPADQLSRTPLAAVPKQQTDSRPVLGTCPDSLLPQAQSSDSNIVPSLSANTLVTLAAPNIATCAPDTKPYFTVLTSIVTPAIHSTELSVPNDQSSPDISHCTLSASRGERETEASPTTSLPARLSPSISQSVIPPVSLSLTAHQPTSLHACPNTTTSGQVYTETSTQPANIRTIFTTNYSTDVTQDMKPLRSFIATSTSEKATDAQMSTNISNQKPECRPITDNCNEPSKNISLQGQLQAASTPSKQTGFSPETYSVTNDPLFAWCTSSPQDFDSFSLNDITGSLSHYGEHKVLPAKSNTSSLNSSYIVTVSVPCTGAGNLLPYSDAPSLDASIVKVELNTHTMTLNQREVIDLCVSDNEEDDPVDINSFSHTCSTSSASVNDPCLKTQEKPHGAACSVSVNSDQNVVGMNTMSASVSPGSSKGAVGQIIKSPLTGRNVVMSGDQMNYIRNHLARLSADLSSITTVSENISSASSVVSTVAHICTLSKMKADTSTLNSAKGTSGQMALSKDQSLVEPPVAPNGREQSINPAQTVAAHSATEETHIEVFKKETFEPICIDDDDDEESDVVFIESIAGPEISHPSSNPTFSPSTTSSLSHKGQQSASGPRPSVISTPQSVGRVLASVASWSGAQVTEWLKQHKLDKICPNLSSLDGRGLQRMAFEHQQDPNKFYTRVKKTLGLTFFQTMVICQSMKELNDNISDDN